MSVSDSGRLRVRELLAPLLSRSGATTRSRAWAAKASCSARRPGACTPSSLESSSRRIAGSLQGGVGDQFAQHGGGEGAPGQAEGEPQLALAPGQLRLAEPQPQGAPPEAHPGPLEPGTERRVALRQPGLQAP